MKTELKNMLMEMSADEAKTLLFPENEYKPLWRWMQTKAGKASVPNYDNMGWAARAKMLSQLTGWVVDEKHLRTTFVRYDAAKRRKQQM